MHRLKRTLMGQPTTFRKLAAALDSAHTTPLDGRLHQQTLATMTEQSTGASLATIRSVNAAENRSAMLAVHNLRIRILMRKKLCPAIPEHVYQHPRCGGD
jgi:hypothetical protein